MLDGSMEEITHAMEPRRLVTIWARGILVVSLLATGIVAGKVIWSRVGTIDKQNVQAIKTEEIQAYKRDWFIAKRQEIEGLKHQLKLAQNALASIDEQRKRAWISRQSDREIYNLAVSKVFSTEENLLNAIKEYNSAAALANPAEIAGLDTSVSVN